VATALDGRHLAEESQTTGKSVGLQVVSVLGYPSLGFGFPTDIERAKARSREGSHPAWFLPVGADSFTECWLILSTALDTSLTAGGEVGGKPGASSIAWTFIMACVTGNGRWSWCSAQEMTESQQIRQSV
jgi:hypothetical protein